MMEEGLVGQPKEEKLSGTWLGALGGCVVMAMTWSYLASGKITLGAV